MFQWFQKRAPGTCCIMGLLAIPAGSPPGKLGKPPGNPPGNPPWGTVRPAAFPGFVPPAVCSSGLRSRCLPLGQPPSEKKKNAPSTIRNRSSGNSKPAEKSPVRSVRNRSDVYYCLSEKSSWVRHGAGVGATGVGLSLGQWLQLQRLITCDSKVFCIYFIDFGVHLCPKISTYIEHAVKGHASMHVFNKAEPLSLQQLLELVVQDLSDGCLFPGRRKEHRFWKQGTLKGQLVTSHDSWRCKKHSVFALCTTCGPDIAEESFNSQQSSRTMCHMYHSSHGPGFPCRSKSSPPPLRLCREANLRPSSPADIIAWALQAHHLKVSRI